MYFGFDTISEMGIGWNLGNTLDSIDNRKRGILRELTDITPEEYYETYWGNPVTTAEMINAVAGAGFGVIRVPVTYADHMDEDFNIRIEWLERVERVVNYVLDNGIYCIINLHHDTGSGSWPWLKADPENIVFLENKLSFVWTQIADYFKHYGDKLIFEGFNEILDTESRWGGASRAAYEAVNRLNQAFVDAVRAAGGGNETRRLIVKTYAAGTDKDILDAFVLPDDTQKDLLIAGVHFYGSMPFTWRQEKISWTKTYSDWNRLRDGKPVEDMLQRIDDRFIKNRVPVIICEFGAQNKNNNADRVKYAGHYVETAARYGISCIWWDDGGIFNDAESVNSHALLDRNTNRWFFGEIVDAMVLR